MTCFKGPFSLAGSRLLRLQATACLILISVTTSASAFPTTPFLTHYWRRPVLIGGPTVPAWPVFERKLNAQACALCHDAQYNAWRKSRMAEAMGPGVIGQLAAAGPKHWPFVRSCLSCHAPAGRQWRAVRRALAPGGHLSPMAAQGVTCADCHVRHYQRFGPAIPAYIAAGNLVHNGFTPKAAFTRSRFCISCHQFHRDGAQLDGVLLENTYNEWRASHYAQAGVTCQSCHMPHGSHSFPGIHNPRFVRRALTIHLAFHFAPQKRSLHAVLTVMNSGVGHDFPTYTTPRVILSIRQLCGTKACADSERQFVIGRSISLDLRRQYFDTRLKPGASRALSYHVARKVGATALNARIVVYPDAAYVRFFRAYLKAYTLTPKEHAKIERALSRDEHSRYVLWSTNRTLKPTT